MMKDLIIIDSSVLITSSLFWEIKAVKRRIFLRQKKFDECVALFELFKNNKEDLVCVITKTVETEASSALKKAVDKLLTEHKWKIGDIIKKFNYSTLRNIIYDNSLDRMEEIIEEYSTRFPMDKKVVNEIINKEIDPFFKKTLPLTCRYLPIPFALKRLHGSMAEKKEILQGIKDDLCSEKIIYIKGEPMGKDKIIMAESVFIRRLHKLKKVFLASLDYHFIPNPTQIETFKSPLYLRDYEKMDSGMRDLLLKEFGFFGDRPKELIKSLIELGYS